MTHHQAELLIKLMHDIATAVVDDTRSSSDYSGSATFKYRHPSDEATKLVEQWNGEEPEHHVVKLSGNIIEPPSIDIVNDR